jgi:hypothetical protein
LLGVSALRSSIFGLCNLIAVGALASCSLVFPSDPAPPPVAFRISDGVLEMLIPECASEDIVSAAVYDYSPEADGPPVWSASGHRPHGDPSVVVFSESEWNSIAGSYAGLTSVGLEITTRGGDTYGGGLLFDEFTQASQLPAGVYLEGSSRVTQDDFERSARESCDDEE